MNTFQHVTFRDYLRIYFRHKPAILITFFAIMGATYFANLSWTPVYQAEVNLLITAQKKIEAPYYEDPGRSYASSESEVALTQSEIMSSNPVLQRAVEVLKLQDRPKDYEKQFATPFKVALLNAQEHFREKMGRFRKSKAEEPASQERLIQKTVTALRESIDVTTVKTTNMLRLTVKDYDPQAAAKIANVISRSFVIFDLEQQLAEYQLKYGVTHEIVKQLAADVDRLISRIAKEPRSAIEAIGPASVKIIAPAAVPLEPQKFLGKKRTLMLLLITFLAAFASLVLAMLLDYLDQTFKSPGEITALLGIPYLGFIPRVRLLEEKIIRGDAANTVYRKACDKLSDLVYLRLKEQGGHTLLLTSTLRHEGAGVVTANLGRLFSKRFGLKTLVIDADFRKPSMHRHFNLPPSSGLANVLSADLGWESALREIEPNLHLLGAGETQENPVVLLTSAKLEEVLRQAKDKFAMVLIHTPPTEAFKDAELVSAWADAGLYIVAEGTSRRHVVIHALGAWRNQRFPWMGAVLNKRRLVIPSFLYRWT